MSQSNDLTDIWAWTHEDEDRLIQKDGRHKAIIENYHDFWRDYHHDNVAAELAITQALEAARETDEIKWQLHLRHWRLQLWLSQQQIKRALPEAVDLLSLATDRRVQDVPQRICAFHDVVECYKEIDPAGYHEDIVANSQDVLAQLPKRHPCATCARSNLARTFAAVGKTQDAEYWINQLQATMTQSPHPGLLIGLGTTSSLIGNWDEAERFYQQARDIARKDKKRTDFIEATLHLVRVYLEKDDVQQALDMLQNARYNMRFQSFPYDHAKLAEAEGRIAARTQRPQPAVEHLTRAARLYLDLGNYRDAALTALYAAEVAQEAKIELPAETLDLAAQAVGELPATSQDAYQKLAAFGRQPVAPSTNAQEGEITSAQELEQQELCTLQDLLQEHVMQHHYADISMMLYRLATWHARRNQMRAAVDYLIAEAALERLMKLPSHEREDAIKALSSLREDLPDATIEFALAAAQNGPPSWLHPLLPDISLDHWRWTMRGIEAEITDRPFVEPEPRKEDARSNFNDWLNHCGGMTALILRFYNQCDPQEFVSWAEAMDDNAEEIASHNSSAPKEEIEPVLSLVRGFAALARGSSVEEVATSVLPPFTGIITQTAEIAKSPVWFHPDASPIDFLVEQAAQKAVRALRNHDKGRSRRLKNLALRYKLMTIDLREQEPLVPMARFLDALREVVLSEGEQLQTLEQALDAPFDAILAAVVESGNQPE
jgi:hypothetical protein